MTVTNTTRAALLAGCCCLLSCLTSTVAQSTSNTPQVCGTSEPCAYAVLQAKAVADKVRFGFTKIPTWCVCESSERCFPSRYDRRKGLHVYACVQLPDQVEVVSRARLARDRPYTPRLFGNF